MIFSKPVIQKTPSSGKKISPKEAMSLAIQEARKGLGRVSPNPPVGCVVVDKNHQFLSSGYHRGYGLPHAEIEALKKITNKKLLKKAHIYVTLEPCAHEGKTPACIETLLKYPFYSLTYGEQDPNPKTQGKSLKLLKKQGIKTKKFNFFQQDIKKLHEVFSFNMKFGKTFVALKVASSLDGMIAFSHGENQWISCEKSRHYVSYLRGCYDGVLIGRDTFLQDNPRLNSRHPSFRNKKNKVIILDPKGHCEKLISKSRLAEVRDLKDIILVTEKKISSSQPFQTIRVPKERRTFSLESLLIYLYKNFSLSSLLVEGGAGVFSSFLKQNQIQRFYQFISPVVMGSVKGRSWTEEVSLNEIHKALILPEYFQTGEDILLTGLWSNSPTK